MKIKPVKEKKYIIVMVIALFFLFNAPMVLAKNYFSATEYLPAILAASVEKKNKNEAGTKNDAVTLRTTGNFLLDYNQAIEGLPPDRFSLYEVVRRYNEMQYNASVCHQVSYYHLAGGPFDKIIINNKLYDILVIESLPKRWNHGPFSMDNTGQCKNWP
ncbi:hypothetical protein [Desulfogranum marinum]|uniref:hypothetical protein n=1 Tax=Desulfogranum marinum TaxID=453220 RepID=UPI0029C72DD3|nr:hypothetical protein [Desulfogranum marinum]